MIHFNERDLDRMARACEYYKSFAKPHENMVEEFDRLIHKIHNYEHDIECDDCVLCELHA